MTDPTPATTRLATEYRKLRNRLYFESVIRPAYMAMPGTSVQEVEKAHEHCKTAWDAETEAIVNGSQS